LGVQKLTFIHKDEIQQECPYWFQLRDLHGERPSLNVTEAAVRNSASSPKLDGLRKSLRKLNQSKKTVAAVEESDDAFEDESHSEESDEEDDSSFEDESEEEDNDPPAAKNGKGPSGTSNKKSGYTSKARRRSITESELDQYCDGRRELSPLDTSIPEPEPVVKKRSAKPAETKSSTTSSAPMRRGKDSDGIFEIWKSATNVKHEVLQSRKRKRDESKAAESIEKMRRDADRADREATAAIAHQKQANALTWIEKRMEIARMTGDMDGLAEYAEQYQDLFSI
jgi:hypothetical protein